MKQIRVGLAGFGTAGRLFHAPFIHTDPSFCLSYVYERTRDEARKLYPDCVRLTDFDALLASDCDLIVIALPNQLHYDACKKALIAGKHVLCDKPFCASSKEARELEALAKEKGLYCTVYQNRRFDAEIRTLKKLMAEGKLGKLVDVSLSVGRYQAKRNAKAWKSEDSSCTGLHYDLGIHLLDAAYSLFGRPEAVSCQLRTLHSFNSVSDRMDIILFYPDDLRVSLSASQCAALPGPALIAHGTKGSYVKQGCDIQESYLNQGLLPGDPAWHPETPRQWGTLCEAGKEPAPYPSVEGDYGEFYRSLARSFPDGTPPVTPGEAAEVLSVMEAALLSDREKRIVSL